MEELEELFGGILPPPLEPPGSAFWSSGRVVKGRCGSGEPRGVCGAVERGANAPCKFYDDLWLLRIDDPTRLASSPAWAAWLCAMEHWYHSTTASFTTEKTVGINVLFSHSTAARASEPHSCHMRQKIPTNATLRSKVYPSRPLVYPPRSSTS